MDQNNEWESWPTRRDVVEQLNVGMSTLRRWEAEGRLSTKKDARGVVRIDPESLARVKPENKGDPVPNALPPDAVTDTDVAEVGPPDLQVTPEGRLTARAFRFLKGQLDLAEMIVDLQVTFEAGKALWNAYLSATDTFAVTSEQRERLSALCHQHLGANVDVSNFDLLYGILERTFATRAKLKDAQARMETAAREIKKLQENMARLDETVVELTEERDQLQLAYDELAAQLEDTQRRLQGIQEAHWPLTQWAHQARNEIEQACERIATLEGRLEDARDREAGASADLAAANAQTTALLQMFLDAPRSMDAATRTAYFAALTEVRDRFSRSTARSRLSPTAAAP